MLELTFLKELLLIKQANQSTVMLDTVGIQFQLNTKFGIKFQTYACNSCHDLLMMFINFDDIAILNINGVDYCCNINGISKSEAVNLLKMPI